LKRHFLASMAVALTVGPAFAADMPVRYRAPPPPPPPSYSWTGCYIGANAGWAQAETSVSFNGSEDFSRSKTGGAFGGQIGCDYQFASSWVIGIQAMVDGTNLGVDRVGVRFPNATFHADVDQVATVTGRLGFAVSPAFLLYGKLGWGSYKTSISATNTFTGAQLGSASNTHSGLDVGVGGEWMFAPNFSMFIEWDHISPKDSTVVFANLAGGTTAEVRRDLDKVLVGINWRFGGRGGYGGGYGNY
jgi:outer membrane immunogenic protein